MLVKDDCNKTADPLLRRYGDGVTADGCSSLSAAKKPSHLKNLSQGLGWKSHTAQVCERERGE